MKSSEVKKTNFEVIIDLLRGFFVLIISVSQYVNLNSIESLDIKTVPRNPRKIDESGVWSPESVLTSSSLNSNTDTGKFEKLKIECQLMSGLSVYCL